MPLASGQGAPWAENQWLGRGFMDHLDCYAGDVHPIDQGRFSEVFDNGFIDGVKYTPKLRLSQLAQARHGLPEISSHMIFNGSAMEGLSDFKLFAKGLMRGRLNRNALRRPMTMMASARFAVPMALRYLRYRRMYNVLKAGVRLRLTAEQTPTASSCIKLRSDRDRFGMPRVEVDWRFQDRDLAAISTFAQIVGEYLSSQGLANVVLDKRLLSGAADLRSAVDDANHHMGGARMGASPQTGVVDRDLKVFGTDNLFVAGAAVYPTSGFANPTFTAVALGLRLADSLIAKHQAQRGRKPDAAA
jgi:choline dehydrogenase-like flavoprotein